MIGHGQSAGAAANFAGRIVTFDPLVTSVYGPGQSRQLGT